MGWITYRCVSSLFLDHVPMKVCCHRKKSEMGVRRQALMSLYCFWVCFIDSVKWRHQRETTEQEDKKTGISLPYSTHLCALVLAVVKSLHEYSFCSVSPPWFQLSVVYVILFPPVISSILGLVMASSYDSCLDASTFLVVFLNPVHIFECSPLLKSPHWVTQ